MNIIRNIIDFFADGFPSEEDINPPVMGGALPCGRTWAENDGAEHFVTGVPGTVFVRNGEQTMIFVGRTCQYCGVRSEPFQRGTCPHCGAPL